MLMVETEAVISCDCHEPEQVVTRHIYPMPLTAENLQRFWELSRKFRTLFGHEIKADDFKSFCEMFIGMDGDDRVSAHGLFWRMDDFVGVYYMTHIQENDAQIHYSFFDRRHHGRQAITRKMIQYVFNRYGFRRLSAEIPYIAKGAFQFVHELGMKTEGRKRKAVFIDGEWFDTRCFGVLREEAESWG